MGKTLLISHPKYSWREWVNLNTEDRDLLILDPANADFGAPARILHIQNKKVKSWRLTGSIDPQRCPIQILTATSQLNKEISPNCLVVLFSLVLSPTLRQLSQAITSMIEPEEVFIPAGSKLERQSWIQNPIHIETPFIVPPLIQEAQRKARWIEMIESGEDHVVELADITTEGTRLGSGTRLAHKDFEDYGEVCAGTLHVVTTRQIPETEIGRVMDIAHARRLNIVAPSAYSGLICSFAHNGSQDFGMGVIRAFDPVREVFHIRCQAVPPAPVKILKIGSMRITDAGQELDPPMPWSV